MYLSWNHWWNEHINWPLTKYIDFKLNSIMYLITNFLVGLGWGDDLCLIFMNVCFFLKVFKGLQYHKTSISTQILSIKKNNKRKKKQIKKKNLKNNSNMLSVKFFYKLKLFKCFLNVLKTDKYVLDPKIHVLCQYHQQNYTYHKLCFLNDIN